MFLVGKWDRPSEMVQLMCCFQPIDLSVLELHCCLPQCYSMCYHWGRRGWKFHGHKSPVSVCYLTHSKALPKLLEISISCCRSPSWLNSVMFTHDRLCHDLSSFLDLINWTSAWWVMWLWRLLDNKDVFCSVAAAPSLAINW